jgi:ATP-binding cassette subfamily F protein 3
VTTAEPSVPEAPAPEAPKPNIKRLNPIKLKQLEDRLAAVEQQLPQIESTIATGEEKLGHFTSAEESQRLAAELDTLRTQRTTLLAEWEDLAMALEEQSAPSIS